MSDPTSTSGLQRTEHAAIDPAIISDMGQRLALLSDALLSEDGVLARLANRQDEIFAAVKKLTDETLKLHEHVRSLQSGHEEHEAKLRLVTGGAAE